MSHCYLIQGFHCVKKVKGLTAEYPSTPKEILKSVATRLRRHAECRLSYRGHVEFEYGYAATRLRRKPRVQVLSERERERAPHLQILSFIHLRKETHFSCFHSFH